MRKKLKIAVVGAGRLGTVLATTLFEHGYVISEIVSREAGDSLRRARKAARQFGAEAVRLGAPLSADVIWICAPDAAIGACAATLARTGDWTGKIVFHSSGALSSDELSPLAKHGAAVASVHPMMSFVPGIVPELAGVTFAIEGDAVAVRAARRMVRELDGNALAIRKADKVLYHAWGAFGSPLIVAELAASEAVAAAIGISSKQARQTLAPMLRQTIENYIQHGAAASFSGPIVRGDVETVRHHVRALRKLPHARQVYLALARTALKELPAANRRALEKVVGGR